MAAYRPMGTDVIGVGVAIVPIPTLLLLSIKIHKGLMARLRADNSYISIGNLLGKLYFNIKMTFFKGLT